ncbi:MAG: ribbon-helix-helix protein, CopG family [Firmicutes bacterium]|nr:ribbon-helix-helix protein, CopG family [Bacillota bacterium]
MRTTIDIDNELRAKLLALAARAGLRGYSEIVRQAIEEYIARHESRQDDLEEVLNLRGSLSNEEAKAATEAVKEFWERWKSCRR